MAMLIYQGDGIDYVKKYLNENNMQFKDGGDVINCVASGEMLEKLIDTAFTSEVLVKNEKKRGVRW